MGDILQGFATIGIVIAVGLVLAHLNVLGADSQVLLARLAFFVASPALMVTVVARSDVSELLSRSLVATAAGIAVSAVVYVMLARAFWRRNLGEMVVGALCSSYVNSANLGLPIAAYVLGDAALVAPILLVQLLFLQPLALALLDTTVPGRSPSAMRLLLRPLTNPLTVGSLIGLLLALTDERLPSVVHEPLVLLGGMAVPGMLLAYGVSLRFGPLPGTGASTGEVAVITALKMVVYPVSVYLVGHYLLNLGGHDLFAVTVLGALPTAQNVFVHATRYDRAVVVARDTIFVTTLACVPAMFVATRLLT